MPKEISTLRKQAELNAQEESNENEMSSMTLNGDKNRLRSEPQNSLTRHENANIEIIEEQEEEYEKET